MEYDFTTDQLLGWFYLLRREGDDAMRKHIIRIAVQHGLMNEQLADALSMAFDLESA